MKKFYVKPETKMEEVEIEVTLKSGSRPGDQGDGPIHSNERNTVFDDEPAASGDEGGYKRTLW